MSFRSNSICVELDEALPCDKTASAEPAPYSDVGKSAGLYSYCLVLRGLRARATEAMGLRAELLRRGVMMLLAA